jgi:hypothetical protein
MSKSTLEEQVENVLGRVKDGLYDAAQLRSLYRNVEAEDELTDTQRENLVEAIEFHLWKDHPRQAKKILGPRNNETRNQLENYFVSLRERFDLSANHHKNKVKLGGNVIAGEALIFDYISYRNNDTRTITLLAFRKLREDTSLDIVVEKCLVGERAEEKASFRTFTPEQFQDATDLYESYLTSVLADEITE